MRVQLVDPSAFTPPYDRSLAAALARAGADVELLTSRFLYGPVPERRGLRACDEPFYRRSAARGLDAPGAPRPQAGRARPRTCCASAAGGPGPADVVHYQWLTVPALDSAAAARGTARG